MAEPRQTKTALVFCIADHPVLAALLTVCREMAASGQGLRSADDYRRWWFIVTARSDDEQLALPPDAPGLDEEEFIPGFTEGAIDLLVLVNGLDDVAPIVGNVRPYWISSHSRLTDEPLEDYVRDRGFDVLRIRDLLARDSNQPRAVFNDMLDYEEAFTGADLSVSADDRIAFDYVLGNVDDLPSKIAPSEAFFESVPTLPHPDNWIAQDHRVFDVLCRAGAFERIHFNSWETRWSESIHGRARELQRRGASPLEAFRGMLGRDRSLPEDLEFLAASERLRGSSIWEPSVLEHEIDRSKRALVRQLPGLAFDGIDEEAQVDDSGDDESDDATDEIHETDETDEQPALDPQQPHSFSFYSHLLRNTWAHDDLLIAVGHPNLVLRSIDGGDTWTMYGLPLNDPDAIDGSQLDDGRLLVVATGNSRVAFSWDRGETWTLILTDQKFCAVAVATDGRVCVVGRQAWFVADDPTRLRVHKQALGFVDVTFDGGRFIALGVDGSVLTYEHDGWQRSAKCMSATPHVLAVRGDSMMVVADEGVATSEDGGRSWSWTPLDRLDLPRAAAIAPNGTRYIVAGQVLASEDGERWRVVQVGDHGSACDIALSKNAVVITSSRSIALVGRDSTIAMGFGASGYTEHSKLYTIAKHGFAEASLPAKEITALFVNDDLAVLASADGLLLSEDRGRSWTTVAAPLRGRSVKSIVEHHGELWAACEGVLRSSDGGRNWMTVEAPLITKLLVTVDGDMYAVRGEWLLRRDLTALSGWHVCRRFDADIEQLASDASGTIYLVANDLYVSHDDGRSFFVTSSFERTIVGIASTCDGLLVCDEENLHLSRDHGRSFESCTLPLHIDYRWHGAVTSFCGSAGGDLYFSCEHFLLYSSDFGRTLARVRTPVVWTNAVRSVIELDGRSYLLLQRQGLLERVDGPEVPEPRFIGVSSPSLHTSIASPDAAPRSDQD